MLCFECNRNEYIFVIESVAEEFASAAVCDGLQHIYFTKMLQPIVGGDWRSSLDYSIMSW